MNSFLAATKSPIKGMAPVCLGEMYGPVKCEHNKCGKMAWTIWITEDEFNLVKGDAYITHSIFEKKLGIALCEECEIGNANGL